jgi:hypothetical protein
MSKSTRAGKRTAAKASGRRARTRFKITVEVDPTPRTEAQERAWSEFWRDALAEARRRLSDRN